VLRGLLVAGALAAGLGIAPTPAEALSSGSAARFEGRIIDLRAGWGAARACIEHDGVVDCYRSEKQMLAAHPQASGGVSQLAGASVAAAAACSSSLRLYDGTSFGGQVLTLTTRQTTLNLSSYGFDNLASSYKVGACATSLYASANLGGSAYPGSTAANSSASSMLSGWNNTVSSVWIG
jgi:hypothetical protein